MSNRISVAVVQKETRFLMAKRRIKEADLTWTFPGGGVSDGESERNAAEREVKEEIGIICKAKRMLGSRIHPSTGKNISYILCDYIEGQAKVLDSEELVAVEWMSVSEIFENVTSDIFPPLKEYLQAFLNELQ